MADAVTRVLAALGADLVREPRTGDPSIHGVLPRVIAEPRSAEEAALVLRAATAEGLQVEPVGTGSRADWGRPPRRVDVLLGSRRLGDASEYEPADLVATVAAGTTHAELERKLREHGQWLPLDPPCAGTLGATFAQAAAGPLRAGFGPPRSHVLGLEVVTGDGKVLRLGGRVVKNVAGYDLVRLVVGSRGTLGFITRLSLRLRPMPRADSTLGFCARAPEPLLDGVAALRSERLETAAIELLSPVASEVCGLRGGSWSLLVRVLGGPESVRDLGERVQRCIAADAWQPPADVWQELATSEATSQLVLRLGALPAALSDTLGAAIDLGTACGTGVPIAAHAADGIVRVWTRGSPLPPGGEVARAVAESRDEVEAGGTTVIIARAPSNVLRDVDPFGAPGPSVELMRGLKQRFDPGNVLSPERYVV